jgi:hypothetical protein
MEEAAEDDDGEEEEEGAGGGSGYASDGSAPPTAGDKVAAGWDGVYSGKWVEQERVLRFLSPLWALRP